MNKWYLYEDEEVIGPFTPDQLRNRLDEDTLVCRAGSEDWQKAGTVDELKSTLKPRSNQPSSSPTPSEQNTGKQKTRDRETTESTGAQQQQETNSSPERTQNRSQDAAESATGRQAEETIDPNELIEPTLANLRDICERAENDALLREYEDYWANYDADERRIILEEIQNRGLFEQT